MIHTKISRGQDTEVVELKRGENLAGMRSGDGKRERVGTKDRSFPNWGRSEEGNNRQTHSLFERDENRSIEERDERVYVR